MSTSVANPNPWAPYDNYRDCSQGICSIYCPQFCYLIFPDDDSTPFSPLIIAIIGVLATAFLLVSYYTVVTRYCKRRNAHATGATESADNRDESSQDQWQVVQSGLDEAIIKKITVCKFVKGEGLIEGTDCAVCLSEFQENESLRLLPKCTHAFHLPWLRSQSNCPFQYLKLNVRFPLHIFALSNRIKLKHDDGVNMVDNMTERNGFPSVSERISGQYGSEDGPGIDAFQIIGDAKPGYKLSGCGYPIRGTSLCLFQWVRHYPDGTRQCIEEATNPDYIVTADDVDKLIAVECIPMDEQGRQGDLVRIFANDNNKITCDAEMQEEIDTYISLGMATFSLLILLDSSENWEPATLFLRRSGYQIKDGRKPDTVISEKYSKDLSIKIPSGLSGQFVLTCSNGSSYPFNTSNDIRMRDTVVLTMRIFQSKALDEKRKSKA